jgi:hypothetical protein
MGVSGEMGFEDVSGVTRLVRCGRAVLTALPALPGGA